MRLHQVQPAPVPGIAVRADVVAVGRHRRLEEHALPVVELDVVAELAAIPVDMAGRPVLVEVVVAEPRIDRHGHAVRRQAALVALAELLQLRAFARQRGLAAAIVGHVAAHHQAERRGDRRAGAGQATGRAPDPLRPDLLRDAVERRHVTQKVGVGLAFLLAGRRQAAAHAAGMDVVGEQERRVGRLARGGRLPRNGSIWPQAAPARPRSRRRRSRRSPVHVRLGGVGSGVHLRHPTADAPRCQSAAVARRPQRGRRTTCFVESIPRARRLAMRLVCREKGEPQAGRSCADRRPGGMSKTAYAAAQKRTRRALSGPGGRRSSTGLVTSPKRPDFGFGSGRSRLRHAPARCDRQDVHHRLARDKVDDVEQVGHHAGMIGQHAHALADRQRLAGRQRHPSVLFAEAGQPGALEADQRAEVGLAAGIAGQRLGARVEDRPRRRSAD